jgi:hypothetical protein
MTQTQEFEHLEIAELGMAARRLRQGRPAASRTGRPGLRATLLGADVSPQLTAAARAIVYVVLIAACNVAILYLTATPPQWLALYDPILIGALRQIEGVIDALAKGDGEQGAAAA